MIDKFAPGCWVADQPAVLVTLGVIPASDSNSDLDAILLQRSHLQVELCKYEVGFFNAVNFLLVWQLQFNVLRQIDYIITFSIRKLKLEK